MNSYTERTTRDLQRIFESQQCEVTDECLEEVLQYFSAETRRSFLNGLKRSKESRGSNRSAPQRSYKTALQAGRLKPVQQSG